jgi:hypothetical protein
MRARPTGRRARRHRVRLAVAAPMRFGLMLSRDLALGDELRQGARPSRGRGRRGAGGGRPTLPRGGDLRSWWRPSILVPVTACSPETRISGSAHPPRRRPHARSATAWPAYSAPHERPPAPAGSRLDHPRSPRRHRAAPSRGRPAREDPADASLDQELHIPPGAPHRRPASRRTRAPRGRVDRQSVELQTSRQCIVRELAAKPDRVRPTRSSGSVEKALQSMLRLRQSHR